MPADIHVHPTAIKEARSAYRWYFRRSPGAARRFQAAVEAAIAQIADAPDSNPLYLHGTRCRLLRRFPYVVVYRQIVDGIQILAVAHGSRRPGYWRRRKW